MTPDGSADETRCIASHIGAMLTGCTVMSVGLARPLAIIAALFLSLAAAMAQGLPTADQVKAAYVHKLPGYVEWPPIAFASAESPLLIGVLGSDGVAEALTSIAAGRPTSGRPVVVKRLARLAPGEELHILFIGDDAWAEARKQLTSLASRPVLVVTEAAGALERGAMLNFVTIEGRVRFEVAPAAAEQRGLKVSSRLLTVAQRVVRFGT